MIYVLYYKFKSQWFFRLCSLYCVNMLAVDTHFSFFRIVKNDDILCVQGQSVSCIFQKKMSFFLNSILYTWIDNDMFCCYVSVLT
jgi:hypothetical protein